MNSPVQSQFERLHQGLDALEAALERREQSHKDQQQAHQELLQRYWSQSQRVATAARATEEYETLLEENAGLRKLHQETQERLRRLLGAAKALTLELRQ